MSTIEPDDRVICCPECRSVFEAEDDTLVDVEAILAARLVSVEALDDDICAALMAAKHGSYDGLPADRHLERLLDKFRAALRSDAHTEQKGTGR